MQTFDVYLEQGMKRTFAGAIDWPGWCRSGRDDASALAALVAYGDRYARALARVEIRFQPPRSVEEFRLVEQLVGGSGADYGVPEKMPAVDAAPVSETELAHFQGVLRACWLELSAAAQAAAGKELRKGPRGGGRDLDSLVHHVVGSEGAYLNRLGFKILLDETAPVRDAIAQASQAEEDALYLSARGEAPKQGPRGGRIWPPRYFVRRAAWHILDHAWEIEDRIL